MGAVVMLTSGFGPGLSPHPGPLLKGAGGARRILVMPVDEARVAALERFHAAAKTRILRVFPGQGSVQVLELSAGEPIEEALARYRACGLVRFAEPDYAVSAAGLLPSDPHFQDGTQWSLNNYGQSSGLPDADIDGPEAWDVRYSASNVVVAIVDTGVRHTHEDLAANMWRNPADNTPGFNGLTGGHDPWDDNGHGTHLAGIIGAVGDNALGIAGVAWRVQIMACKFLDSTGNGYNSDAISCIEFARTNGANIINLSWGGPDYSDAVSNALWFARRDGIVVVAAAGNNAANTDLIPFYPAGIRLDNIVAAGASTRLDGVWILSNYGVASVDLFAPGAAIYSTANTGDSAYVSQDGSSMASACVAGACALLRAQEPALPPAGLIGRLLAAVDKKPAFANKCASGGRLNLRRALDRPAITALPNAPPFELLVTGAPQHWYVIEASTNLATWSAVQTNRTDAFGAWTFTDPPLTSQPLRFYRAGPGP